MIGIDTNILVRYLTEDDKEQSLIAAELLETYTGKTNSIFINNIIICELIWVLDRGYKYKKKQITDVIKQILSTEEFAFERQDVLWLALDQYNQNNADFSDCLIAELNKYHNCQKTFSFDKSVTKLNGFTEFESQLV